jgi:hypothetical protein
MLILNMRVEAGNISVRAILQGAAALGMPRGGSRLGCSLTDEAKGGHTDKRSTSSN